MLINITGYVEIAPANDPSDQLASAQEMLVNPPALSTSALQSGPIEQTAGGSADAASANSSSTFDSMQSDQADSGAPKLQLVSHTLSIKRKKICTQHPVQVASSQPTRLSEPIWTVSPRRPQQQQQQQQQSAPMRVPTAVAGRLQPPAGSSPASEPQTVSVEKKLALFCSAKATCCYSHWIHSERGESNRIELKAAASLLKSDLNGND